MTFIKTEHSFLSQNFGAHWSLRKAKKNKTFLQRSRRRRRRPRKKKKGNRPIFFFSNICYCEDSNREGFRDELSHSKVSTVCHS
ncbi:hypothetical protein CEXT_71091 [Caerostris extrusa]|uniref:Uncharacterized protein n=1 Tax=Caerostris extrusa TaxID=172846 RepID=A0AAV4XHE4_CAEEX|nr:hypothetical protein CEXT_71091 [Caerostris extrusa]